MKPLPIDQQQRIQALDTQQSFIVQAPAGSGKTYLLTQRYLKLLAEKCTEPETILALTFTNKAAHEMRDRILSALKKAKEDTFLPQEAALADIAKQALARDQALKWNILQNPHRLRIQTLDAFSLYLAQQLPITSRFGTKTNITDSSQMLYQQAARRLLKSLETTQAPETLKNLVLHLENNYQKLEYLLSDMLSHRDQWLPLLLQQKQQSLKEALNHNLAMVLEQLLVETSKSLPSNISSTLLPLLQFALQQFGLPETSIQYFSQWQQIAILLLTKEGEWRKTVNKHQGFPAPSESKQPTEKVLFKDMKKRMEELLLRCREENYSALQQSLHALQQAPDYPYRTEHLDIIEALFVLLPILTAELMLIFKEQQCVDFIEIQQRALLALGDLDEPTDVTLKLDHKIEHVLIDEFQDTSISQFQLLQRITHGFMDGDGRTVFLVGDPMQSIYGFRAAEVGIFLQVKYFGIGDIKPVFLQLNTNFRSHHALVQFYNQTFDTQFPKQDNIHDGAISYAPSEAFTSTEQIFENIVQQDFKDEQDENRFIIEQIKQIQQTNPEDSIAILVEKRPHLKQLLPLLQQQQLPYQAVDIENLFEKSIIHDLYALTRAMLFLHDRVAWLSILRAPWCGLTLSDLHAIANADKQVLILERIKNFNLLDISEGGKIRLSFIVPIFSHALQQKQRCNLRVLIENTWHTLNGPQCLTSLQSIDDAEQFFLLLEKHQHAGDLLDVQAFENELKKLYASSNTMHSQIQIMTIHKSKGLEFDHVFLPFSKRKKKPSDKKLLMWLEKYHAQHQRRYLILAPFFSKNVDEKQQLQNFVKTQKDKKNNYELIRLKYVAYTRAKKSLYLSSTTIDTLEKVFSEPMSLTIQAKRLMLNQLANVDVSNNLTSSHYELTIKDPSKQLFGTLIHQLLQHHGEQLFQWSEREIELIKNKYPQITQKFPEQFKKIIFNIQQDKHAKWIFSTDHQYIEKEFSLTTLNQLKVETVILDRTFVDQLNQRWIIDFKTSDIDDEQTLELFLQQQKLLYQSQLQRYARLMQTLDARPIFLGLYFPLIPAWCCWQFETENIKTGKLYGQFE